MAAMSRGSKMPKKGGTPSSRRHHFESFSQRIAKLKIEPIRRGRGAVLDDTELESAFSYFRDALAEWRELNLSETFAKFARQVTPLCDSLPQLIHHGDRILELLIENIEKGDNHSEEPLLSLMAHFAHDLGVRFEKYFERAVTTISQLAATHADVQVIEWSFTCLAWLFKYLSKLLVPDLRPLFRLMAPLLGKERQKPFVARFAAESLSFLVRKAGAVHHRDKTPLKLIINYVSELLRVQQESGKESDLQEGLMSLFAESMQGVQRGLHSSAVAIMEELLLAAYDDDYALFNSPPIESVLVGVITAVIHHSDAEHFHPLLLIIIKRARQATPDVRYLGLSSRLIFVACAVRKGSRVIDWEPVLDLFTLLLDAVKTSTAPNSAPMQQCVSVLAVAFQYCHLEVAISHIQLLETITKGPWEKHFLPFCNVFAEFGPERFSTLLLPYFKRFIALKAHDHGDHLCFILPDLYRSGLIASASLQPTIAWQNGAVRRFQELIELGSDSSRLDSVSSQCNSILDSIGSLVLSQESEQSISQYLYDTFMHALEIRDEGSARSVDILAAGKGFNYLVEQSEVCQILLNSWVSICSACATYGRRLSYWKTLLALANKDKAKFICNTQDREPFKRALLQCLSSPIHDMRLTALGLLEILAVSNDELQKAVATALLIEQTPANLETQRSISMRVGQLARMYPTVLSDEWVGEAIPAFCFGLLHARLASVWEDACTALRSICETKEGEAYVSRIAFEHLSALDTQESGSAQTSNVSSLPRYATKFECTNAMQLEKIIIHKQTAIQDGEEHLKARFNSENASLPFINSFSRTQALRFLNDSPHIVEKRSRQLVPVLLDWVLDQKDSVALEGEEAARQGNFRWARNDQKAMLSIFSKFINPRVLYRSNDVYEALLVLLGNGDAEIQKSALKAILAWKEPAITEYQENLFHLLDDARFRDEISVFLDIGSEHSSVKIEHRDRLLPVLLRLLYGRVISGKRGLDIKRKVVFQALSRFEGPAISEFLKLALGALSDIAVVKDGELDEDVFRHETMALRKQIGMLNMLEDMLSTLRTTFRPFVNSVVEPILYCLIMSSRILSTVPASANLEKDDKNDNQMSMSRVIRQRSLHALTVLFEHSPNFDWDLYAPIIVQEAVNPRIQQFPIETAQSVSGLLRLFSAWSKSLPTASYLVEYNDEIFSKIIECLGVPSAKAEVKCFVLDNVLRTAISLTEHAEGTILDDKVLLNKLHSTILQPYSDAILSQIGDLIRKSPSKEVLESGVQTIAELAPHVVGAGESRSMIEISAFLLRQPSKRVNNLTKSGLLKILHEFIPRCSPEDAAELFDVVFEAICPLFSSFQDRQARATLCEIMQDLSAYQDALQEIAGLCYDLNAFSTFRLDEPDFDRRSAAFDIVVGKASQTYSLMQWKPLVFSMLFFIKDNDELSIRVNASLSLRCFIQASSKDDVFKSFISAALLPGIQTGMRSPSELVRIEYLAVLAQLVQTYRTWSAVADLSELLTDDEEASFYNNILHIQGHRRLRALRRLVSVTSRLQSGNIYHILFPLLEHFVFNKADDESANGLAGETIKTISTLSQWIEWPQFRSLVVRYIGYLKSKEDLQKPVIKLISGLMDSLNEAGRAKGYIATKPSEDLPSTTEGAIEVDKMNIDKPRPTLNKNLPQQEKLTKDLINNILPDLTEFSHRKDDSTVSLRVPIATAVTKVLLLLPPLEIESRLPPVLLDLCHILRSRAQDSRDMSRNTLAEIASFAGPAYLGFILKALRTALQRGYQLHVLSFTLHSILVRITEQLCPGDLDYCLPDIVDVIMDDTFGITGQEKDAEDYITKMKEVKSSKSFDSMDIIARCATPSHLVDLIQPIVSILMEKLHSRAVQKVDELLRRIGLGVLHNLTVKHCDILRFCYELIQEAYKASNKSESVKQVDSKHRKYLVNIRGAAKSGARFSSTPFVYKVTRFGLDLLRTVLRKHEELLTPQNIAGFLPILGDSLVVRQEEVQISAIRLLSTLIKVPMRELDENCPVYVTEAVRVIKGAPSSNSEIAQASLKFITAVLRERSNIEVQENQLALLLKGILPDLDEPDRQGVTFGFLKAVMSRKIVIAEVYEAMDKVAVMMVTNQTRSTRDLARSSYFHFLMEYPQAKNRFKKQVEFLLKNLRYDHVEGRQSVMEALNLILTKVGDNVLQDQLGMMFIPLVHSVANDDSNDCRTMAGALMKKLFERADSQRLNSFTSDLKSWLKQDEDSGLKRLGIQCWGMYFEAADASPDELTFVLEQLSTIVDNCLERRSEEDWELIYYSLLVFSKVCKTAPESALSTSKKTFWAAIRSCISYPHVWVKVTAAKLIGTFFADLATSNGESALDALPLKGSYGLQLGEQDMIRLTNAFLKNLSLPNASEELCAQSIRNLAFLARCLAANGVMWNSQNADDAAMDDTEMNGATDGDTASSKDEFSGFSPSPESPKPNKTVLTAIHRLMTRLSGLIRRETKIMRLSSLYPKTASMTLVETLVNKLPVSSFYSSLPHLLTTLSTLTDPATTIPRSTDPAFNDTYRVLIDKAREITNVVQARMGTQEYLKIIGKVQKDVRARREERRQKRKVDAVLEPEKWGKEKKRRNEVKKIKRKEKSAEYRGKRRGW